MRRTRWMAAATAVLVLPAFAMPLMAEGGDAKSSKIEAIVADLDGAGNVASIRTTGLLRVYADGSFSVDDGGTTQSGNAKGSKDFAFDRPLTIKDGLVQTPNGVRALPVSINAVYKLNGTDIPPDQLGGKTGDFEVDISVTNRTLRAEEVSYNDATTGKTTTAIGQTAIPITAGISGIELPDANFDNLTTNGVLGRSSDGKSSTVSWSAFLAPPMFGGTQTLTIKGTTNGFKMSPPQIAAQMGASDQLPGAVKTSLEKGGASTQTIRGYISSFGDGFGQLNGGLGQIKTGVDALTDGLNNTKFDAAKYAEDSTLKDNQPGALEALRLFDDGIGKLMGGLGQIRTGLSSGDLNKPGVQEALKLLEAGIGTGSGTEWDCSIPRDGTPDTTVPNSPLVGAFAGKPCDVNAAAAGMATPGTVLAILETYKAVFGALTAGLQQISGGLSGIKAGNTQIEGGIAQVAAGIGDPAHPKFNPIPGISDPRAVSPADLASALFAIRAGTGTGSEFDCSVPRDGVPDATIPASLPGGGSPCDLAAALTGSASAVSALAGLNVVQAVITNLQGFYTAPSCGGTGACGAELLQSPLLAGAFGAAPLSAQQLAFVEAVMGVPENGIPAAGIAAQHAFSATSAGIGSPTTFDCPPYHPSASPPAEFTTQAGCTVASPGAKPTSLEAGLAQIYAGIGTGSEFLPTTPTPTPLTLQAINVALGAGLSQINTGIGAINVGLDQILAGIGSSTAPTSVIGALSSLAAGIGTQQSFDCPPYTPQPVGSATAPFGSPNTPDAYAKGTCDESTTGAKPGSAESGMAQIKSVLGTLATGVGQIVTGLGDLKSDGTATKAVTTRTSKFGNKIEDPATALYGMQAMRDGFKKLFDAFGSRNVAGSTVLSGLQQLSDGLALTVSGTATGRDGATQLGGIIKSSVVGGDQQAAFQNAGIKRAQNYAFFVSAPNGASSKSLFLFRMPAIG